MYEIGRKKSNSRKKSVDFLRICQKNSVTFFEVDLQLQILNLCWVETIEWHLAQPISPIASPFNSPTTSENFINWTSKLKKTTKSLGNLRAAEFQYSFRHLSLSCCFPFVTSFQQQLLTSWRLLVHWKKSTAGRKKKVHRLFHLKAKASKST